MNIVSETPSHGHEIGFRTLRSIVIGLTRLKALHAEWQLRRHDRSELRRLLRIGPHMIEDVGLNLDEAMREAAKPFWAP